MLSRRTPSPASRRGHAHADGGTPTNNHTGKSAAVFASAASGAKKEKPTGDGGEPGSPPDPDALRAAELAAAAATKITVAVRIKPTEGAKTLMRFGPRSENALRFCHLEGAKADDAKNFAFDHVFDQGDGQADLYDKLGGQVLQQVLSGYNASVFAYGQTGSGKTYTMLGTSEAPGLIPRLCEGLFKEEALQGWSVSCSFFEIYNEQVVDLLAEPPSDADEPPLTIPDRFASAEAAGNGGRGGQGAAWQGVGLNPQRKVPVLNALRVREDKKKGVYVEGLTMVPVGAPADVAAALERGTAQRAVAETAMNAESSRSHAVVQIHLAEGASGDRTATLNLIDLAGSENVGRSRSYEDHNRLAEAKNINKSLLGLGKCISMLAASAGGAGAAAAAPPPSSPSVTRC